MRRRPSELAAMIVAPSRTMSRPRAQAVTRRLATFLALDLRRFTADIPLARRKCVDVLSMVPAAVLAALVHSAGDYGSRIPDDPAPTIAALVHGHLSAAAHNQPFMGLTSILLRLPFAAIATALGGGRMLTYRFGVLPCALVLAVVLLAVVRRAHVRPVVGVLIAAVVAAPLVLTLPAMDPTAFARVSRGIGDLTWPSIRSWWWMVSGY